MFCQRPSDCREDVELVRLKVGYCDDDAKLCHRHVMVYGKVDVD